MRPRKALGQHFLSHPPLLERIAAVTGATSGHVVLEIGPGRGALTAALLDYGATVVAIERDARLQAALQRRFTGRNLVLVTGDALELDWGALVAPWLATGKRWIVAGNIPYNITSPLLHKALTAPLATSITFLVQLEVADRIVAAAGSEAYGALSIGIQAVARPSKEFVIGKAAFTPAPKVDSAVLHLVPRDKPLIAVEDIPAFRRFVTAIFSYRRKRLLKSLREATGATAADAGQLVADAGLDPDARAETIDVASFVRLFERVRKPVPFLSAEDAG